MKKLSININKAQLKSYTVRLEDGKPIVEATIELLTDGGKSITTYSVSTNAWQEKDKFDLPTKAIMPIIELAEILESVVVGHCRDGQVGIEAISRKKTKVVETQPIDLSEMPF
jgi:hypothetical protein